MWVSSRDQNGIEPSHTLHRCRFPVMTQGAAMGRSWVKDTRDLSILSLQFLKKIIISKAKFGKKKRKRDNVSWESDFLKYSLHLWVDFAGGSPASCCFVIPMNFCREVSVSSASCCPRVSGAPRYGTLASCGSVLTIKHFQAALDQLLLVCLCHWRCCF